MANKLKLFIEPRLVRWTVAVVLATVLVGAIAGTAIFHLDAERARLVRANAAALAELGELRPAVDVLFVQPCLKRLTQRKVDAETAARVCRAVLKHAMAAGIDPRIVLGKIQTESGFVPVALSETADWGLSQINLPTWAGWFDCDIVDDLECNVAAGVEILARYRARFGSIRLALTAYNRGEGTVARALARGQDPDNGYAGRVLRAAHTEPM